MMPVFCQTSTTRSVFSITLVLFVSVIACAFASNIVAGEPPEETWVTLIPSGLAPPAAPTLIFKEKDGVETTLPIPESAYYVGGDDCSDAGPGDRTLPFCSFETALDVLQPGDTLVIKAGPYDERLEITNLKGKSGKPITIRGESRDSVVFDGGCPDFPCSLSDVEWQWDDETGVVGLQDSVYVTLRDISVQNAIAAGISVVGGGDIGVENVEISRTGNAGLLVKYMSALSVTNNDIGRVQLGWRDEAGEVHFGAHEALSIVGVSDFTVAHNYVHDTPKEGIDVKESSTDGAVHDNVVERACAVGIYINEAHNVHVYRNQVRRSGFRLAQDGTESLCSTDPIFGKDYGKYYGNGISPAVGDLGDLSQGKLSEIRVYQNVVWDSHGNGLQFWDELRENGTGLGEMRDNDVYNNVFYKSGLAGIRLDYVKETLVANNIIALNEEEGITGNAITDNTVSNHLFTFSHDWHQPVGANTVIGDPLFVDPANGDFHLQAGSPAIDRGLDVGLQYMGNAPDIGAYEIAPQDIGFRSDGAALIYDPDSPNSAQNPAFSPDSDTILFSLFHSGYNIGPAGLFLISFLGINSSTNNQQSPIALLDEADQDSVNLPGSSWNAISNKIVFASDRVDTDEIWTMSSDGSDLFRVTHHSTPGYYIEPSFSPDGAWIVFEVGSTAPEIQQQGSIWKVRLDGTGLAQLTDSLGGGTDDRQPNWSPVGDRIVFQRRIPASDDWNLYTIAPDGSDIRPVTTTPSSDTDASWSPDGRWIVYSSDFGGLPVPNIFVIPTNGGKVVRVTFSSTHEDSAPSWSPGSSSEPWIAFESHEGVVEVTPASLWRIPVPEDLIGVQNFYIYMPGIYNS